jgi:undecaprenyl diphosphate synthase
VTEISPLPRHIAIIMDGNGRWAKQRGLPRIAGHRAGVEAVRRTVRECTTRGVEVLTLFAFSSENWRRPKAEVRLLMELFVSALQQEVRRMHDNNVQLRVIGDRTAFNEKLQRCIADAEAMTRANTGLTLVIAANYGGQWDITQAARGLARKVAAGALSPEAVTAEALRAEMCLSDLPEPDLFIRSGGEKRISNFLLWQLAYTEMHFTECLWPDFDEDEFRTALTSYARRQRRFGRTGEQIDATDAVRIGI